MPYILKNRRYELEEPYTRAETAGELNFKITEEILAYLRTQPESYESINAVIGVLECAKLELYRRVVVPYEKQKCKENGDVYP